MICLICRDAHITDGLVSINFERHEFRAVIHHIPAQVCPACGESYLSEETATILLNRVEQIFDEGIFDVVQAYA